MLVPRCRPIGLFDEQGRFFVWLAQERNVRVARDCTCAAVLLVTSAQDTGKNAMNARMRRVLFIALFVFGIGALVGRVTDAKAQTSAQYGLEWPGDGAVRRMLYWHNPFPIYDATYVFKVYPRKKTSGPTGYYTTFFWGNDGKFSWDGGYPNTYYGAHPYPIPAPKGPGQWEIAIYSNDYVTGSEVQWNRWYTQVFRAWRVSASETRHEFYWDWPDTTKVIRKTIVDTRWASRNPPTPAIVMGQAPNLNGASWGGYPGWEEFNGVIRGVQIYSGLLSLNDLQAEIAVPESTIAGRNFIWYLNVNPRPTDVTDKKSTGTPHNPSWAGTTALEWSSGGSSLLPTPPIISGVSATNITGSAASIRWTTNEPADGQVEYGTTTAYGQITPRDASLVTSHAMSLSGLAAGTTYRYRVRSTDAAGYTAISPDFTFATVAAADTTPPAISAVAATNVTASSATITWTTSEPATTQVDYGTTSAYGQSTTLNSTLVTAHSLNLSGLSAATAYHFRVRSRDASGNSGQSSDMTFATSVQGSTTVTASAAYGLNEAFGSTTADATGHGYQGTLINGPLWTSGRNGSALLFDGVDDKVSLPSTLDISKLPFTLEAWIRPSSSSRSDWRAIFSKRSSYSLWHMRFDVGLAITSGRVYVTTAQSFVTFAYAPPLDAWTHVAIVAESWGTRLYVNGILTQTLPAITPGSRSDALATIGNTGDNDDPFAGVIDDLRLHERALSATEIQSDMISGLF
jgi:Concanavalin A-like lectin/glucanases superfamily/Purple acid Phosphatase, N-terminal domain